MVVVGEPPATTVCNMAKNPDSIYSAFEVEVKHPHYARIKYQVYRNNTELTFFDHSGEWCGTMNVTMSELPAAGSTWTVRELPSGHTESFKVVRIIGRPTVGIRW